MDFSQLQLDFTSPDFILQNLDSLLDADRKVEDAVEDRKEAEEVIVYQLLFCSLGLRDIFKEKNMDFCIGLVGSGFMSLRIIAMFIDYGLEKNLVVIARFRETLFFSFISFHFALQKP